MGQEPVYGICEAWRPVRPGRPVCLGAQRDGTSAGRNGRSSVSSIDVGLLESPNPDAPWDCHICRSVGVFWEVNVGIYGIHGVFGK